MSIDRMRHATFLPVHVAQDAWHAPPMNVDVAWDVMSVASEAEGLAAPKEEL